MKKEEKITLLKDNFYDYNIPIITKYYYFF